MPFSLIDYLKRDSQYYSCISAIPIHFRLLTIYQMISPRHSSEITLETCLDDVEARFLYNLPESELSQAERLFFQIEQAWWFYEDFMADKHKHLPHFGNLKSFAETIFQHCPLLRKIQHNCEDLFNEFGAYKNQIPVFGCILLSPDMKKIVLICNWKGTSWGFPRGKINEGETPLECAIRETWEETGFEATNHCRKDDSLVVLTDEKVANLFIATNVPENTVFEPQVRKEISKVEFFDLNTLPKRSYGVHPFIPKLRHWISKRANASRTRGAKYATPTRLQAESRRSDKKRSDSFTSPDPASRKSQLRDPSIHFDSRNADTFAQEVSSGSKGWNVSAMFAANAKLTGRAFAYDGNPHAFGAHHPLFKDYRQSGGAVNAGSVTPPGGLDMATIAANSEKYLLTTKKLLPLESLLGPGLKVGGGGGVKGGTSSIVAKILPRPPPAAMTATSHGGAGSSPSSKVTKVKDGKDARAATAVTSSSEQAIATVQTDSRSGHGFMRSFVLDKPDVLRALDAILKDASILAAGDLLQ